MKILKPVIAAAIFFLLTVYFTYYFSPTLSYLHLKPDSGPALFVSSPFNMQTEGHLLYNLYLPTILIFVLGFYLKNFNRSFQRKCNLRTVFIMAIIASYVKSWVGMQYIYNIGYSDHGISLGTSIITLSFLAAFVVSLEVYIEGKEKVEHLYGHFMFAVLSSLILLLAVLIFFSFFSTSSLVVHLIGLTAFMLLFIPYYERRNIARFLAREKRALAAAEQRA